MFDGLYINVFESSHGWQMMPNISNKNESCERKYLILLSMYLFSVDCAYGSLDECQPIKQLLKVWNQDDKMSRDDE